MIQMARAFYPQAAFDVADGAALPYSDRAFEVVISGCVLLHCPNYAEHIKESCRVTQKYLLLHRTPISLSGQTRFFEKLAYGVPTVEIWFSQEEILDLFSKHGFELVERDEYSADVARQVSNVSYLLRARADV
jgi:ubiquinone/menaquinone biosynthesis C-methylase UbiE